MHSLKKQRICRQLAYTVDQATSSRILLGVKRPFATNDQGGNAVQGKPDDPNTVAPKDSQKGGPSGADPVSSS